MTIPGGLISCFADAMRALDVLNLLVIDCRTVCWEKEVCRPVFYLDEPGISTKPFETNPEYCTVEESTAVVRHKRGIERSDGYLFQTMRGSC